jgi:hypothetical protein
VNLVVTAAALVAMVGHAPTLAPALDTPTTYVLVDAHHGYAVPGVTPHATATRSYKDYDRFAADAQAGLIPANVRAVIYDPEAWSLTPLPQQQQPSVYEGRFVRLARQLGLEPILAPARTLLRTMRGCRAAHAEALSDAYLRCGVPRSAAAAFTGGGMPGIYSVPSQHDQLDARAFRSFYRASAAQAAARNANVQTIAGLSCGLYQGAPSASALLAAARASGAGGFWLTVNRYDDGAIAAASGFLSRETLAGRPPAPASRPRR